MGWAARKVRIDYPIEDTGARDGFVYSPLPDAEPYIDAMRGAWRFSEIEEIENAPKPWICDDCGTHHEPADVACLYCGRLREDDICD